MSEKQTPAQAIAEMVNNMDVHIRFILIKAKLCRAYHEGLIKEGFTENEALELCKYFSMD